jgi:glycosyltransferase involved in cell wall biosynthesis
MPLSILFVTGYYKPAYVYGGPTKSASTLCESIAEAGVEVTVFTTNANGRKRLDVPLATPVSMDGVNVWYFPLRLNGLGFFYAPSMGRALANQASRFDLAVIDTLWGYPLHPASRACLRNGVPFIVSVRGQLFDWSLRKKRIKKALYLWLFGRRCLRRAAAIQCCASVEKAVVADLQFGPPAFVVANPVNLAEFAHLPERGYWRRSLGISKDAVVLLFLGRLTSIKRPDIAIEALAASRELIPDVHLIMAGYDQENLTGSLKAQAARLGCLARVHWTGLLSTEEVRHVLADSDLLVAPSEVQENFGMAAAEALAAGVPVLLSEGIPVGRWVNQWHAGRVVPCKVEAFRREAKALIASRADLRVMGQNGRLLARSVFNSAAVAKQMIQQFEAILQTRLPHPAPVP